MYKVKRGSSWEDMKQRMPHMQQMFISQSNR